MAIPEYVTALARETVSEALREAFNEILTTCATVYAKRGGTVDELVQAYFAAVRDQLERQEQGYGLRDETRPCH